MNYNLDADDYEMAEAALAVANHPSSIVPALRILRDECGWPLSKAKAALDMVVAVGGCVKKIGVEWTHPSATLKRPA